MSNALASVSAKLGSSIGDTERGLLAAARWWLTTDSATSLDDDLSLLNLATEQESLAALTFLGSLRESARGPCYARLGERLIERWPDSEAAWYHFAQMARNSGQQERARHGFEKSYAIRKTEEAGIACLEVTGSVVPNEIAELWARRLLTDFPESGEVATSVGILFRNWGRWEQAESYLKVGCQHSHDLLATQWELATVHYLQGNLKEFELVFMQMAPRTDEQLMAKILYLLLKQELDNVWRVFLQLDERRVAREVLILVCTEILVCSIRHKQSELTKLVLGTIRTYGLFSKRALYWLRRAVETKRWLRRFQLAVRIDTDQEYDGVRRYLRVLRVWADDAAAASDLALEFLKNSEPPAELIVQSVSPLTKRRELALQYRGVDEYLYNRILEV